MLMICTKRKDLREEAQIPIISGEEVIRMNRGSDLLPAESRQHTSVLTVTRLTPPLPLRGSFALLFPLKKREEAWCADKVEEVGSLLKAVS